VSSRTIDAWIRVGKDEGWLFRDLPGFLTITSAGEGAWKAATERGVSIVYREVLNHSMSAQRIWARLRQSRKFLPSSRSLAKDLGMARSTAQKCLKRLTEDGLLATLGLVKRTTKRFRTIWCLARLALRVRLPESLKFESYNRRKTAIPGNQASSDPKDTPRQQTETAKRPLPCLNSRVQSIGSLLPSILGPLLAAP